MLIIAEDLDRPESPNQLVILPLAGERLAPPTSAPARDMFGTGHSFIPVKPPEPG